MKRRPEEDRLVGDSEALDLIVDSVCINHIVFAEE